MSSLIFKIMLKLAMFSSLYHDLMYTEGTGSPKITATKVTPQSTSTSTISLVATKQATLASTNQKPSPKATASMATPRLTMTSRIASVLITRQSKPIMEIAKIISNQDTKAISTSVSSYFNITSATLSSSTFTISGTQSSNTPSGCTTASSFLGMTNRKIRDTDITASSELDSNSSASNARLNNTKSWVPDTNDTEPWIQVNFGKIMNITAISTQGFPGSGFVSSFYFSYNVSEMEWLKYTIHGGLVKVFQGNTNDNGTKRVLVNPLVTVQYVRLHPTNCSGHCALRMEFYGCKSDPTIGLPGQPLSLKQISISSSMINITWDPPTDIGDGIKGYTVKWQEVNGTSGSMQKDVPPSISNRALLAVTPYTLYEIYVQAYNDEGSGLWSEPLRLQSSESVPSAAPANFTLSSSSPLSLTASWDAIPVRQQQGKLLGYQVFYKKEGPGNEQNWTVAPDQFSYTITDLEFTSYSVRVAGFTAVGIGNSTVVLTKTPNEGTPSSVRNLQLDVLSPKSIKVRWEPPVTMNGRLRRYVVTYGTARNNLVVTRYSAAEVSYQLTDLEEFTVYYVQVYAETSVSGTRSLIVDAQTLEDAPSAFPVIDETKTEAEDAHTITVTWKEIAKKDQNGIILVYTVAYNVEGQPTQLSLNTTDTTTVIRGLKPYTSYCIRVRGYTKIGPSAWSNCTRVRTLQSGPSRPRGVFVEASSSTTIDVKWSAPAEPNGVIQNYLIEYGTSPNHQPSEKEVTNRTFQLTLTGLEKFTTYYIKVRGKTSKKGNASEVLNATTFEDRPGPPGKFAGRVLSDKEILITWEEPVNANGIIRTYHIRGYETKTGLEVYNRIVTKRLKKEESLQVFNLKPYTNFIFTIQAKTIELGERANFTAKTWEGVPGKPALVTAMLEEDNINVFWEEPVNPNGIITKYNVDCEGRRVYNTSFKSELQLVESETSRYTSITKEKLKPGTKYTIYVTAFTVKGEGARSNAVSVSTPAKAPSPPPLPQVAEGSIKPTEMTIFLTKSSDSNGRVVAHEVVVEKVATVSKRSTSSLPEPILDYKEAMANGDRYYIAARFERDKEQVPRKFVLGDGEIYGGYENAPLEPMTKYKVYVRAATDVDGKWVYGEPAEITLPPTGAEPVQTTPSDNVGIIAGVLGALVLIVIIIIAVLLYKKTNRTPNANLDVENQKRKRREIEMKRSSTLKRVLAFPGEFVNDPDHPPIPVEQFAKHVIKLHKSDDRGYMIEYNKLDSGQEYEINNGLLPENKVKNRYANIIAYDHSRVVLSAVDGIVGSDYINASRVDGYNKPNAYIATQGPVPPAFDDFWRMVWEQQSSSIVMLTNLQERHKLKCHKYWPDETQDYGDISVMLVKQEHYSDYIIRTFNLKRESEKEEREVKQFHFTVWPDHGVPEYPTALLAFRRRVRRYNPADAGPLVVHCSAGVGRTGTFVVVDSMLDRIKAENTLDIYNFVAYLRTRRTAMVQTEEQYTFCHDAILEAVQCGNTQIYAHDLRITLARMDDASKDSKVTRFESEFKTLNKVSPVYNKAIYLVASYPENKEKNRTPEILAPDFYRVVLTAIDDNEVTSYINAVHIPGYKQQHAFIVTQHPLTPTVTDFWRMLCEQECSCVVLFDSSEEDGDFPLFWPEEESTYDDMITVQRLHASATSSSVDNLKANYDQTEISEKSFKATDLRTPEKSLRIKMFQYSGWVDETDVPPCSGLISLIAKVERWQQHSGNGPITVVCSDGLGRSGTFCALYSVLERLKIEQVVDVFQAIKAMRIPRPGLVKTTAEYRFIHYAILDYLSAFDDYANFKP